MLKSQMKIADARHASLERTMDDVRARYGDDAVTRAPRAPAGPDRTRP